MTKIYVMIYSLIEYKEEFYPTKSVRTIQRLIKSGKLQQGHIPIRTSNCLLVEIRKCENYEPYIRAIHDYLKVKKIPIDLELSTELGIKYDVESIRYLNEILGLI